MNINAIQYSLPTLSLEIYVAGCNAPHCVGCHNPILHDFDNGAPYQEWEKTLRRYAVDYMGDIPLVRNIWVLGGEPLDQPCDDLVSLLTLVRSIFKGTKVWLFTRYDLADIPAVIVRQCDFVKTGRFTKGLDEVEVSGNGIRFYLASSNQRLHKIE